MILVDSDVILVDRRYPNDPRFPINQRVLQQMWSRAFPIGITQQAILEVVGILSFNVTRSLIPTLFTDLAKNYRLRIIPDPQQVAEYAGCSVQEIMI